MVNQVDLSNYILILYRYKIVKNLFGNLVFMFNFLNSIIKINSLYENNIIMSVIGKNSCFATLYFYCFFILFVCLILCDHLSFSVNIFPSLFGVPVVPVFNGLCSVAVVEVCAGGGGRGLLDPRIPGEKQLKPLQVLEYRTLEYIGTEY